MQSKHNTKNIAHVQQITKRFHRAQITRNQKKRITGILPEEKVLEYAMSLRFDKLTARLLSKASSTLDVTAEHLVRRLVVEGLVRDGWHERFETVTYLAERYEYDNGLIDTSALSPEEYSALLQRVRRPDDIKQQRIANVPRRR